MPGEARHFLTHLWALAASPKGCGSCIRLAAPDHQRSAARLIWLPQETSCINRVRLVFAPRHPALSADSCLISLFTGHSPATLSSAPPTGSRSGGGCL